MRLLRVKLGYFLRSLVEKLSFIRKEKPIGLYHVQVVSLEEELDYPEILPLELNYVLRRNQGRKGETENILKSGKALGVRTVDKTPERVLKAINRIATMSQHLTIVTWLPELIAHEKKPIFTEKDLQHAKAKGVDLNEEVAVLLGHRREFKKFVLIDEENVGITREEQEFIKSINDEIFPITLQHTINRMTFDNAHERTAVAQTIIKSLLIVGPVAHYFETVARGIGKIFAASMDDVMSEAAEMFALKGSGFTWKQLASRSKILIPVFILATYGAYNVEGFIVRGDLVTAGVLFGLSAVALSLTTALQSIRMYHHNVITMVKEGKIKPLAPRQQWLLALHQDFTNPARVGLFAGAIASPIIAMTVFVGLSDWIHNGFVLALLGSTEALVAALTVFMAKRINNLRLRRKIKKLIKHTHVEWKVKEWK
ncbi:MAG: hypothetical protein HY367_00040 [Candidatus Aenigmarchaeota archaeon]|nr:hypothetical protein [Candidatus Aenigmarchaeota archaeon]